VTKYPTIVELAPSSLGDMLCVSTISIVVRDVDMISSSLEGFSHSYPIMELNELAFFHLLKKSTRYPIL
jgi:hypothetical protein